MGETLRTIMNTKGLEKKEWPKLVKYLEFVYRMTPMPGTNICPFEAARGRKPKLPSNICLGTSESASAYKSLDDTAAEAVEYLNLANKLVKEALEKSRTLGQEAFNQKQVRVDFEVGELVRFWNRVGSDEPSVPAPHRRHGHGHNSRYGGACEARRAET